jgi:hypothetical protein
MPTLGDTFVWCPPGTVKDHLWIILSDPSQHDGKCVLVNLTESVHGQYSFTLVPGQHRWIYKDSDVNFGDAFLTSQAVLQAVVASGSAIPHDPIAPQLLKDIIAAAGKSPAFPPYLIKYL